jgi:ribonuclease Z
VFETPDATVLVDCGGSPVGRLLRAGLDPRALTHVVITHIHADHAYGLPSLLQNLRLLQRRVPLPVLCRPEHVEPLRQILALFGVGERPGAFEVVLTGIDLAPGARALEAGSLALRTTGNAHGAMPNFAVRAEVAGTGAVVYSSDTEPTAAVVDLARGAHTLIHEATFPHRDRGRFGVHSTAREAGEVAARAGVRRLILTHVDAAYHDETDALAEEAGRAFGGPVEVARDLDAYPWPTAT